VDKQKILIVDDQYGVRTLLSIALNDYEIREAVNGQQALEIVKIWVPDLIIIDMKMPGLDGIDTVSKINKLGIKSKVLLMTAYNDEEIVKQDIVKQDIEISGFISKPFDLDELIQLVKKLLNQEPDA